MLRKLQTLAIIVILCISYTGESKCDAGYIEKFGVKGSSWCIPEFEEGLLHNFNLGTTYYRKDFGVINYNNGIWFNSSIQIIKPIPKVF